MDSNRTFNEHLNAKNEYFNEIEFHGSHSLVSKLEKYRYENLSDTWDKGFKNGPDKICERQPLKNLKGYGLLKWDCTSIPLKRF